MIGLSNSNIEEEIQTIDPRILPLAKGEFRSKLRLEHVDRRGMEVFNIVNKFGKEEEVAILLDFYIRTPFVVYYKRGFTSLTDPYLKELIWSFMYINQGIDVLGIKKMTEFLLAYYCNKVNEVPIFTFEQLNPIVTVYVVNLGTTIPKLLYTSLVLYSKNSMFSSKEKQKYSLEVRHTKMAKLSGELIHNAAMTTIERINPDIKVTRPKVLVNMEEGDIKSVKTLNKHIRDDTVDLLDKANKNRIFKTEKALTKYNQFLELPQGISNREVSKKLSISLSTVQKFRNYE